jgi:hypothetical protein
MHKALYVTVLSFLMFINCKKRDNNVKTFSDCTDVLIKICSPYYDPLRFETCWVFNKHIDL